MLTSMHILMDLNMRLLGLGRSSFMEDTMSSSNSRERFKLGLAAQDEEKQGI